MYSISYHLLIGTVVHQAAAMAALEDIELLKGGGASLVKIVASGTGREISVADLRLLAEEEVEPVHSIGSEV